jgi:hypothetical protein
MTMDVSDDIARDALSADEGAETMAAVTEAIWPPLGAGAGHGSRQMVFGYIRCPSRNSGYVMVFWKRLADYRFKRTLRMGRLFIDECSASRMVNRPALAHLRHLVGVEQDQGVPVIHPRHLSDDPVIAVELAEQS